MDMERFSLQAFIQHRSTNEAAVTILFHCTVFLIWPDLIPTWRVLLLSCVVFATSSELFIAWRHGLLTTDLLCGLALYAMAGIVYIGLCIAACAIISIEALFHAYLPVHEFLESYLGFGFTVDAGDEIEDFDADTDADSDADSDADAASDSASDSGSDESDYMLGYHPLRRMDICSTLTPLFIQQTPPPLELRDEAPFPVWLEPLWGYLEPIWGHLEPIWSHLEPFQGYLQPIWVFLEPVWIFAESHIEQRVEQLETTWSQLKPRIDKLIWDFTVAKIRCHLFLSPRIEAGLGRVSYLARVFAEACQITSPPVAVCIVHLTLATLLISLSAFALWLCLVTAMMMLS